MSISDPPVGESAQAIDIPRLRAQKAVTTAKTQKGFHACRSCAGVQTEANYRHRSPARLLARAVTDNRSLARPKEPARVRLVQRGSKGTARKDATCSKNLTSLRTVAIGLSGRVRKSVTLRSRQRDKEHARSRDGCFLLVSWRCRPLWFTRCEGYRSKYASDLNVRRPCGPICLISNFPEPAQQSE